MISNNIYRYSFRLFNIVLFFVCFLSIAFCTTPSISEADNALKARNYSEAITQYAKLDASGNGSAPMYFNMAIANTNLDKPAEAIVYLQKALKFNPGNTEAKELYQKILNDHPEIEVESNTFLITRLWNQMSAIFFPKTWMWLSVLTLIAGGIVLYRCYPKFNLRSKFLLGGLVILFALTTILGLYRNQQLFHNKTIVITAQQTALKVGPDAQSPDLGELPPGSIVYYNRMIQGWWQVKTSFGDEGWIMATQGTRI